MGSWLGNVEDVAKLQLEWRPGNGNVADDAGAGLVAKRRSRRRYFPCQVAFGEEARISLTRDGVQGRRDSEKMHGDEVEMR